MQEGKFVGKFTAAVSSSSILIAAVWKGARVESSEGEGVPVKPTQFFVFTWQLVKAQGLESAGDKCVAP